MFSNDQLYEKNNISDLLNILDSQNEIGLVISKYITKTNNKYKLSRLFLRKSGIVDAKEFLSRFLNCGMLPCGFLQSMIYRTKTLKNLKFDVRLDCATDQIVSINYIIQFRKLFLNKQPQFIFNITAKRFHSSAKYLDKFKQIQALTEFISLRFDKNTFSLAQKIKLYYNYLKKVISPVDFNSAKSSIHYEGRSFTYIKLVSNLISLAIFLITFNIF